MATQVNYTVDMLKRNLPGAPEDWPTRKTPMLKEVEVEVERKPEVNPKAVKQAQKVVGELVWLSTRCRPDVMYGISKMASLITKDPEKVLELGHHMWRYLAGTTKHGLVFKNVEKENEMKIYTDASFGDQPHGCVLIQWGGSPLLWKSSRQLVATTSTAEAELVEVMEGAIAGEAVRVVLEEVLNRRIRMASLTDSSSALAIVTGETGSWRTKHLRRRAQTLRARVLGGDWWMRHLPGADMPADLGTKVLSWDRFCCLKEKLGMTGHSTDEPEEKKSPKKVEKVEKASSHGSRGNLEAALKAIVLVTRLLTVKAEDGEETTDGQGDLVLGTILVLFAALFMMIGMIVGWWLAKHGAEQLGSQQLGEPEPQMAESGQETVMEEEHNPVDMALRRRNAVGGSSLATASASSSTAACRTPPRAPLALHEQNVEDEVPRNSTGAADVGGGTFYVTATGSRYHRDPLCPGLNNAVRTFRVQRCSRCGSEETQGHERMWALGAGRTLHADPLHMEMSGGVARPYMPCKLCCVDLVRIQLPDDEPEGLS